MALKLMIMMMMIMMIMIRMMMMIMMIMMRMMMMMMMLIVSTCSRPRAGRMSVALKLIAPVVSRPCNSLCNLSKTLMQYCNCSL